MAFKLSTGLRNALLSGGSLKDQLDGGFLHIYSGTPPASPDDAITGDLLATMYSDGGTANAGLNFDNVAADGVLYKAPGETWDNSVTENVGAGTQTATHFLFVDSDEEDGDAIDADATAKRILGTVGGPGSDLVLSNVELTNGGVQKIDSFFVAIPA